MKRKVIGLSGVARSGKDSFCDLAIEILREKYGVVATRYALADELKNDIDQFLIDKVGISAWTTDKKEKDIIRPMLVEYGRIQREKTEAQYWTSKLHKQISIDKVSDVIFVTDIRYAIYEKDEVFWLKNTMEGDLIHISQYSMNEFNEKVFISPPNMDETHNDPILQKLATHKFQWETKKIGDEPDWEFMKTEVTTFLEYIVGGING